MRRSHKVVLYLALFSASCLRDEGTASGQAKPNDQGTDLIDAIADAAESAVQSVVNISATRTRQRARPEGLPPFFDDPYLRDLFDGLPRRPQVEGSLGSGVIVSQDGLILTNHHVVARAQQIIVTLAGGRELEAVVVGSDPPSDLAVLRVQGDDLDLVPLRFADSSRLRLGQVVLAIGDPFGVGQTVTMGIVSATGRANMGIVDYEDFIQTDAAINPGNSGGALVDVEGALVGINTAIVSRSGGSAGIGFAIPSNMAKLIMESLVEEGKVTRGWLGVVIQELTPAIAEAIGLSSNRGVLISDVTAGSPAAEAGLTAGDVIREINGQPVDDSSDLRNAIAANRPGREVRLSVIRQERTRTVRVELAEQPSLRNAARLTPEISEPGRLGLTLAPVDDQTRRRFSIDPGIAAGALVLAVSPASAADLAGIKPRDVILQVGTKAVRGPKDALAMLTASDGPVAIKLSRGGVSLFVVLRPPGES
jgi:Do/DeqQ family serine protease